MGRRGKKEAAVGATKLQRNPSTTYLGDRLWRGEDKGRQRGRRQTEDATRAEKKAGEGGARRKTPRAASSACLSVH
jgi:hypothetical protein